MIYRASEADDTSVMMYSDFTEFNRNLIVLQTFYLVHREFEKIISHSAKRPNQRPCTGVEGGWVGFGKFENIKVGRLIPLSKVFYDLNILFKHNLQLSSSILLRYEYFKA